MDQEIIVFLATTTIVVLVLIVSIYFLLNSYKKRRQMHVKEKQLIAIEHEKTLLLAETEVQNNMMNQISSELHDTVGQKLTLTFLQAQNLAHDITDEKIKQDLLTQADQIQESLQQIRSISKLLNNDDIKHNGFAEIIKLELQRIMQNGICKTSFSNFGPRYLFKEERTDFLMTGLCREFIQNSLKHSHSTEIGVNISNTAEAFKIYCYDNGIGLNSAIDKNDNGQGINNINKRGSMIGGIVQWGNHQGQGTSLQITIKK